MYGDTVTQLKTWGRGKDRLDDAELAALCATYQAGLAARAQLDGEPDGRRQRPLKRAVRAGDDAVEAILGSTWALALHMADKLFTDRGQQPSAAQIEEYTAVAVEAILAAAASFDPADGGRFGAYASGAIRNQFREHEKDPAGDTYGRVGRIARRSREELTQSLGREPTLEELRASVLAYCRAWARERSASDDDAHQKLRKQGILAAIKNLSEVLALTEPTTALPEHPDSGALGVSDGVEDRAVSDSLDVLLGGLTAAERFVIEREFGFAEPMSSTELGAALGMTRSEASALTKATVERLASPHGRFTLTAPIVFEDAPADPNPLAALVDAALAAG